MIETVKKSFKAIPSLGETLIRFETLELVVVVFPDDGGDGGAIMGMSIVELMF